MAGDMEVTPGTFYIYKALAGFETRATIDETGHGLSHLWYRHTIQPGTEPNGGELDS